MPTIVARECWLVVKGFKALISKWRKQRSPLVLSWLWFSSSLSDSYFCQKLLKAFCRTLRCTVPALQRLAPLSELFLGVLCVRTRLRSFLRDGEPRAFGDVQRGLPMHTQAGRLELSALEFCGAPVLRTPSKPLNQNFNSHYGRISAE